MVSIPPWDDAMVLITLDEIRSEHDYLMRELRMISDKSPMRCILILMLDSVDRLMNIYERVVPQSDLIQPV